jgi:hypothetical protein
LLKNERWLRSAETCVERRFQEYIQRKSPEETPGLDMFCVPKDYLEAAFFAAFLAAFLGAAFLAAFFAAFLGAAFFAAFLGAAFLAAFFGAAFFAAFLVAMFL